MFSLFFSFIFFILLIVLFVFLGLFRFLMALFFGKRATNPGNPFTGNNQGKGSDFGSFMKRSKRKKIFTDSDGEYVDYTEVKDK